MRDGQRSICVIGGGFTGVAAAIACLERVGEPFRLIVVEPSAALGRGVAFGGHHPLHLLNVRTRDLSIRFGQPGDFLNWVFHQLDQGENHAGLHDGLAHTFLPRQLFGEYVRQRFFEMVERRKEVELRVVKGVATACFAGQDRFRIHFDRAGPVSADIVVLATAYGVEGLVGRGALAPFGDLASEQLAKAKSMVLIGSGLTMVDVLLQARRDGFQGTATVISPHGQLPRPHAPKGVVPQEIGLPRFKRMSVLTTAVRIACDAAEAHGTPWQAILNGLRSPLQDIWQGLAVEEQARFLRHVRPFWDAHRHRLPLEVHGRIRSEFDAGRALLLRGRVSAVDRSSEGFRVTLRRSGSAGAEVMETDLAFDCTGHKPDLGSSLIKSLLSQGLVRPDAHALGVAVKPDGQVVGRGHAVTPGLFALGPLCQGSLWEITSVPEIVRQADAAASRIAAMGEHSEGLARNVAGGGAR
ncbi:MAG: FAD/NAD(P)-binding protein [Methyloceanibacter sp.]